MASGLGVTPAIFPTFFQAGATALGWLVGFGGGLGSSVLLIFFTLTEICWSWQVLICSSICLSPMLVPQILHGLPPTDPEARSSTVLVLKNL